MRVQAFLRGNGLQEMTEVAERLARFDRAGLMAALGQRVLDQHRRRINSEKTDPAGKAWSPLLPSTLAKKSGGSILIATGKMAGSYSMRSSALMAVVSNPTFYLKFHQGGTRKMAQRRPMGLSAKNIAELQTILNARVAAVLG